MKTIVPLTMMVLLLIAGCSNSSSGGGSSSGGTPGGSGPPSTLAVTTTSLPPGTAGQAYNATVSATGGSATGYTWTLTSGVLPAGLTLTPSGTPDTFISGTPGADGNFPITVQVTDSAGATAIAVLQVAILPVPALSITSSAEMPDGTVAQAYSESITATGGTGAYTWAVIDGEVPPGLMIATNGTPSTAVTGTPTAFGAFYFTIEVTDSAAVTATLDITLIVVVSANSGSWVAPFTMVDDRGSASVFTGSRIIQWGGEFTADNTGDVMFPGAGTVTAITTTGAPAGRAEHTVVWTGRRMIIWGGHDAGSCMADGAVYNPVANTWSSMGSTTATARAAQSAVWTGTEMILWGGRNSANAVLDDGYAYNPATNGWRTLGAVPTGMAGRQRHKAIWTGSLMLVWGGSDAAYNPMFDGGAYDPVTDTWTQITDTGAPTVQADEAVVVWTGSRLFVWGCDNNPVMQGAEWDPTTNAWAAIGTWYNFRRQATGIAIPTGVFVWGGLDFYATAPSNDGEFFDHGIQNWQTLNSTSLYSRFGAKAYWTGRQIIIWGGKDFGFAGTPPYADGVVYMP